MTFDSGGVDVEAQDPHEKQAFDPKAALVESELRPGETILRRLRGEVTARLALNIGTTYVSRGELYLTPLRLRFVREGESVNSPVSRYIEAPLYFSQVQSYALSVSGDSIRFEADSVHFSFSAPADALKAFAASAMKYMHRSPQAVLISTGGLSFPYCPIDAVFAFDAHEDMAFIDRANPDKAFRGVTQRLREAASAMCADAVVHCQFEYRVAADEGVLFAGQAVEMFGYGTAVRTVRD